MATPDQQTQQHIERMAQTLAYNADGSINYIQASDGSTTWRQTFSYTAGQLTGISAWVKQ